jgi:CHAT domain-containing protein/Flp pilus assembly protein TadD
MRLVLKIYFWLTILACGQMPDVSAQEVVVEARQEGSDWLKKGNAHFAARQIDSARSSYHNACSLLADGRAWPDYAAALNGLGKTDLHQGRFAEAITAFNKALAVEEQNAECSALDRAQTYNLLGYACMALEQWEKSRNLVEAGLAIRISELGNNSPTVGPSQYMLGVILYKLGDHQGALIHLAEALRLQAVQPGEESSDFASTLVALGMTSCDRGEFQSAVQSLTRAADIFTKVNDTRGGTVGACYSYLANAYASLGQRSLALHWANRSLAVYSNTYGQFHSELAGTYAVLGKIHAAIGDYDQGEECYRESVRLLTQAYGQHNSRVGQVEWLLGDLYLNKHDLNSALRYSLRALTSLQHSLGPRHPDVVSLCKHIGSIYRERNEHDSAVAYLKLALDGSSKSGNAIEQPDLAEIFTNLGQVYAQSGRVDSALTYLKKSLDIQGASENQDPLILSRTHRAIGDLLAGRHLYNDALRSYQSASQALNPDPRDSSGSSDTRRTGGANGCELLHILHAEGKAYEHLAAANNGDASPLLNALRVYDCAAKLVENLRKTYAREGSKFFLAEESLPLFGEGIRVSMDLFRLTRDPHYKQIAFSFAERSKAGILFDGIQQAEAKRYSGIPDSLLERERQLRADIVFCESQLEQPRRERDGTRRTAIEEKLFGLNQARVLAEEKLDGAYPTYHEVRYGGPEPTVQSIQEVLDNRTTLVSYFVGDSSIWIFVLGRESFDVVKVPKAADFELRVQRARKAIRKMDIKAYPADAYALYRMLVRPIEKLLGNRDRLIVIPDGCLYYVPFEALVSALPPRPKTSSDAWDYSNLQFLIRSREISYAHSARLFAHSHDHRAIHAKGRHSFLGFAPVFRDTAQGPNVPSDQAFIASNDLPELRSLTVHGKTFRELKYSEDEVRRIAEGFHNRGYPGVAYVDAAATEESFKQNAGDYRYIHLATHGYINEEHPNLSALVFSPRADPSSFEDGLLYAGEVYNLRLHADLLVLSSCESGMGKLVKGEGILALTRGFQYAGARNIVYSLWKVLDRQTNALMQEFYGGVLNGKRISQALREAKLTMINDRATAFPLVWAGFVLLGDS